MTIAKRDGVYVVRVELGKGADGRRVQDYKRFRTLKEAKEYEADVISRKHQGAVLSGGRQTYREFVLERFLPSVTTRGARTSTLYNYTRYFRLHILPVLGDRRLDEITPLMLDDLYRSLMEVAPAGRSRPLSPHTVAHAHTLINMSFKSAVRWNLRRDNPAALTQPPRKRTWRKEPPSWTAEEAITFLQYLHARQDRLYPLMYVMLALGLRRGEALGLQWADVDWDERSVAVRRALTEPAGGGAPELTPTKTARGMRTLAVDETVLDVLRAHQRQQRFERWASGPSAEHNDLIFTSPTGGCLRPCAVSNHFTYRLNKASAELGIRRITLHGLRHTNITLSVKAGVHHKVIAERAGHHSSSYTLDTYAHIGVAGQRDAASKIGGLLSARPPSAPGRASDRPA